MNYESFARVLESTGSWYKLRLPDETIVDARTPGKLRLINKDQTNPVAVGDWVSFEKVEDGTYTILEVQERKNAVVRTATHGKRGKQIICANVDVACVVQSLHNPDYKLGLIDRFIAAVSLYEESKVCVIINKMDLHEPIDNEDLDEAKAIYSKLGIDFLTVSIHDSKSIEMLREYVNNKTISFTGPSGVGKTSLLNALDPNLNHKVGEISSWSNKGKHTTTFARLIPIETGGFIVDTPGIREFGIAEIEANDLDMLFADFEPFRQDCKFYNCTHNDEPNCKVKEAVENDSIHLSRYLSYLSMLDELHLQKKKY